MEDTLDPCHLHLVLSICLVAVNITNQKNIILLATVASVINPQHMREGYSTHFFWLCVYVCVCVTYDSGGYADLQR